MLIRKNIIRKPEKTGENDNDYYLQIPKPSSFSGFYFLYGKFMKNSLTNF